MAGRKGMRSTKPRPRTLAEFARRYGGKPADEPFLGTLDGRSAVAVMLKRRLAWLLDDLGGADSLSYAQLSLARRAIMLEGLIQATEEAAADGAEFNPTQHASMINSLVALFTRLGIERKVKDIVNLDEYLAAKAEDAEGSAP